MCYDCIINGKGVVQVKNIDVLKAFVNGETKGETKNLTIACNSDGTRLFNYGTCIAERRVLNGEFRGFKVNLTKYSPSTTAIQNQLVDLLPKPVKTCANIPIGANDLWTV